MEQKFDITGICYDKPSICVIFDTYVPAFVWIIPLPPETMPVLTALYDWMDVQNIENRFRKYVATSEFYSKSFEKLLSN